MQFDDVNKSRHRLTSADWHPDKGNGLN